MRYKIEFCEVAKTGESKNGPWTLTKMSLSEVDSGTIVNDVQTFLDVTAGHFLDGTIKINEQYKTKEFVVDQKPKGNAGYKTAQIEKVMEKKEASIEKFQSSKEEGIRLMAAQRDAVLIVTTMMKFFVESEGDEGREILKPSKIQEEVIRWRNWFLLDKEFNNPPPFA